MRSFRKMAALLSVAACAAYAGVSLAAGITLTTFTSPPSTMSNPGTIGFAYMGDGFVGSVYTSGTGNVLYRTDLTGGSQQIFAPTINIPGAIPEEHFVSSSLGLGGFPSRDVYVGSGSSILHIDHAGTTGGTFISGLVGNVRGILFDSIGTFGNDMLVSTSAGNIYRINSSGTPSLLANVGEDAEGMDIAPLGGIFGGFNGQLFVASEGSGNIRAIDPAGNQALVANVPSAEELLFVPLSFSGNPVEGFYGANYTPDVQKAGASEFASLLGHMIVTGETTHSVTSLDGSFSQTYQGSFPNQPEDGIFVTAAIVQGNVPLPGSAISGLALGALGLAARGYRRLRRG